MTQAPFRRIVLDGGPDTAWAPADGTLRVVLDTARIGEPGEVATVNVREVIGPLLERADLFEESFQLLDAWAEALDLAGRMTVDGISWWYRRRLSTWLWVAACLHWAAILDSLVERYGAVDEVEVRAADPILLEVATAFAAAHEIRAVLPAPPPERAVTSAERRSLVAQLLWRLGQHPDQRRSRTLARRHAVLANRLEALRKAGDRRILVLTNPAVHQTVASATGVPSRVDPFLGPVVDRLRRGRTAPIAIALHSDPRDDDLWPILEADTMCLPDAILGRKFAEPADAELGRVATETIERALASVPDSPLRIRGIDLAPILLGQLRQFARQSVPGRVRIAARGARLIRHLGADAVVLINEYGQTEWVAAGHAAGVPVLAVQHGVILPTHVGYRNRRHPARPLPTRTLVFGPYEARVLVEAGGYEPGEVEVVGAPRLDRDHLARPEAAGATEAAARRASIRRLLEVREGDRMVVLSTTHEPIHRRLYWPHVLGKLFDGPQPDAHFVFKLHPAEKDDGGYRRLLEGLARSGGFPPPRMSVVRDIDLYELLRAADAHLGLYSTVLSDAVAAGTPNLIAATQARVDLMGYIAGGVARPVHDAAALRAALAELEPPEPDARRAFLDDHFLPGDASERIVAAIEREIVAARRRPIAAAGRPHDAPAREAQPGADLTSGTFLP